MTYLLEQKRKGAGFYTTGVAGENLGSKKLVYLDDAGEWCLADAKEATSKPVLGITMSSIKSGRQGQILLNGFIGDKSWNWVIGQMIYASNTKGELTQNIPNVDSIVHEVGVAYKKNLIIFGPERRIIKDVQQVDALPPCNEENYGKIYQLKSDLRLYICMPP